MIALVILAVGLVGQLLLGAFIASKVLPHRLRRSTSMAELAGLGCVLGIGVTAFSLFIWSFCGGPLGALPSYLLTALGCLAGVLLFLKWRGPKQVERPSQITKSLTEQQEFAVSRLCQILIATLFVACLLQTLQTPQKLWDERAIYAIKARVLFEDHSIHSPALMHPDFVQYHPRYPLLLPLAEEHIYALLGTVDDRLSKIVFTLLYCGMVLTTAGVLSRHLTIGRAWLGALVLATVPVLMPYEYGFLCGQGDAPVACFHGLSVLYIWDALKQLEKGEDTTGSLLLAGLFSGLTVFTKDEGIAYLIVDTTILCVFTISSSFRSARTATQFRRMFRGTGLFIIAAGSVITPWFLHRRTLPLTTEMNYAGRMTMELFLSRLDTLRWSVPHLLRRMFWEWQEWGLQWWLFVAAAISRPRRSIQPPQLLFILDIAGALASLLVAGMIAPAQLDEHIGGSSHRFLMQITPVAILFAVTVFNTTDEQFAGEKS